MTTGPLPNIPAKTKLKVAASCFSIYAYEALKSELAKIEALEFVFTAPTFVPDEVADKLRKERREFFIPKADRERSLYGSEFEIRLRNKLTQRAVARECAVWMQRKARFRSNRTKAPMQQFACVQGNDSEAAYMPLHGFTAVDLGYQPGDAVSIIVNRFDEPAFTATYLQLFDQIWNDPEKLEDVTDSICDHVASVYRENSPESIIQRFGRIDRIGSRNKSIQLVSYWPDITLDEYINLKERVENRMMIADVSATGDDNVLTAQSSEVAYRKEQLRRLQEEVIELEDLKTGVSITDLGLNDFRMDLLNYVKEHGDLELSPKGLHAVVPARPELGLKPGVVFTLRNMNCGVNLTDWQNNPRFKPIEFDGFSKQAGLNSFVLTANRRLDSMGAFTSPNKEQEGTTAAV